MYQKIRAALISVLRKYVPKRCYHYMVTIRDVIFERRMRSLLLQKGLSYYMIFDIENKLPADSCLEDMIAYMENYHTRFYSRRIYKFLLSTFKYALEKSDQIKEIKSDKPIYIIHVCLWGVEYSEKMLKFLAPSLLAPGNVPAIANDYYVQVLINCDEQAKRILQKKPQMLDLANYAEVVYDVVPQHLFDKVNAAQKHLVTRILSNVINVRPIWKYYLLGTVQNLAMLTAQRNKAYVSFFLPDLLFSDKTMVKMFATMQEGKKAAVFTAFRTLDTKVEEALRPYYANHALTIGAADLSQVAVDCMHEAAQNRIVSTHNPKFQVTAQLIFNYPNEIVIRALHYHPVLVNFNAIDHVVKFDHRPIDSNLLCNIVNYDQDLEQQIWVNDNGSDALMIEVSRKDIEPPVPVGSYNVAERIKFLVDNPCWSKLNKYLLSKRCKYQHNGKYDYFQSDIIDNVILQ